MTALLVILLAVYIIGIFADVAIETDINIKIHDSSFLPYTTSDKRDATTKDVYWALIWPLRLIWSVFWAILWIINDMLVVVFLLVGFKYKNTACFRFFHKDR